MTEDQKMQAALGQAKMALVAAGAPPAVADLLVGQVSNLTDLVQTAAERNSAQTLAAYGSLAATLQGMEGCERESALVTSALKNMIAETFAVEDPLAKPEGEEALG